MWGCFAVPLHNCTGLPCQLSKLLGPDTRHHSKRTRVTCGRRIINHRILRGLALDYLSLGGLSPLWSRPAGATAPDRLLWSGRAGASIGRRREGSGITTGFGCSLQTWTPQSGPGWVGRGFSR